MSNVVNGIRQHLDKHELRYAILSDGTGVMLTMSCESVRLTCYIRWNAANHVLKIRSFDGLIPAPEQRSDAAEYITRANYGLSVGHFEMDFRDGEISYVTSVVLTNDEFDEDTFVSIFHANLSTHDHYFPGLAGVLCSGEDPEEAVARVESVHSGLTDEMEESVKRLLREIQDNDESSEEEGDEEDRPEEP